MTRATYCTCTHNLYVLTVQLEVIEAADDAALRHDNAVAAEESAGRQATQAGLEQEQAETIDLQRQLAEVKVGFAQLEHCLSDSNFASVCQLSATSNTGSAITIMLRLPLDILSPLVPCAW